MKGIAEAEAMDKKAEAMKKYGEAAILEMLIGVLPDIAKAVAEPISSISDVKIIGSGSQGVSDISGNVPIVMAQVMETVKEATGVDLQDVIHMMPKSTGKQKLPAVFQLKNSLLELQIRKKMQI